MALLQRTRILSNERVDLPDYNNIEGFVCADFKAIDKYVWTNENLIISGFTPSGVGTPLLSVILAGSVAIYGRNDGSLYIGAPSLDPVTSSNLTPSSVNYVEIQLTCDTGAADSRAFWDPTSNGGQGGEFSQIVDTYTFTKATLYINTSAFTNDPNKIPLCEVDVAGNGNITAIRDSRSMFFRLGRPGNLGRAYSWSSRVEPVDTVFTGADKDITHLKKWIDAVMDSIREIKGTAYWYEEANASIIDAFTYTGLTLLTGITSSARFSWSGTNLSLTDSNPSPTETDELAALRVFTSTANLKLTRQDVGSSFSLSDGDVLWIELPDPLVDRTYDGIGVTAYNYRITARGALTLSDKVYWLAYREGSRVYLRGLGELEPGESLQIEDTLPESLMRFLGFNPETATYVPYTALPNPTLFANTFNTSDHLVKAISTNTANINAIGAVLATNAYQEPLDVVVGIPVNSNEVQGPITAPFTLTLPLDSRDGGSVERYVVGAGILEVYLRGQLLTSGRDYNELGAPGTLSNQIEILQDLPIGDVLIFRDDSTGGFNVGGGSGDVVDGANVGLGEGLVYKQKNGGVLELRSIKAGAGISISTVGDEIIISATGGSVTPFFVNYITGQTLPSISVGGTYNMGTDKLEAYRNGVHMINTNSIGDAIDRYQETTNNSIAVSVSPVASDVFTFVNQDADPTYSTLITGQSGSVITVPSYTMGNNGLRVFRNGILMNKSGFGGLADRYTESSPTTISLSQAASPSEVFLVINGPIPSSREDITGQTGTVLALSNSYIIGSQKLFVYRNGALMLNSTTLGASTDRYQETSVNSITLESIATSGEVFTFIIK